MCALTLRAAPLATLLLRSSDDINVDIHKRELKDSCQFSLLRVLGVSISRHTTKEAFYYSWYNNNDNNHDDDNTKKIMYIANGGGDDDDDDKNFIHTRCVSKPQSCGAVYVKEKSRKKLIAN